MSITVSNTIHDAAGKPIVGAQCPIVLIGAAAFDAGNIEIVGQAGTVTTDSTGTWSTTTLTPNSQLTPTGTYYMVYEPGGASHAFVVPATGGPYMLNQLIVGTPTSPAASLGIVRYDVAQPLTSAQQLQAQQNIGTSGGSGAVSSVFGRTGAVVAQTGDYTAAQVGADASGAAAAAQAASLQKSSNLSDVANAATSRTNLGLGTAATQNKVAAGSAGVLDATDASTTNSRTPTAHASTHASAGSDPITVAESQVTNLITDLAAKVPTSRQLAGLDLTADRTASALKAALAIAEADVSGLTADLAARALILVPTAIKTTAYTAAVNDLVQTDATSGSFAVTLPTAPADKSIIEVKKLDASATTVTITCGGSDTFAIGGTTLVLALQGHAARLQYQSSTSKWIALDNDLPLVATDARYVGKSLVTTKGDLITATGSAAVTRRPVGSDGQVLTADSTQADGMKWAAAAGGGVALGVPPKTALTNKYTRVPYSLNNLGQTTASLTDGQMWLMPLPVMESCTLAELHGRVDSTAGTAGSVMRMGVYPLAAGASPLFDSGALASTSASTTVISTANLALTPGWYLIAFVQQGNPATKPSNRLAVGMNATLAYESEAYFANDQGNWAYTMNSVNGALPTLSSLTAVNATGTVAPIVGLKFA